MQYIKKLRLINFKRFKSFNVVFDAGTNVIIGDNEAGKSSILQAIDLVVGGSRSKVDTAGIESILNKDSINLFWSSDVSFYSLPEVHVEIDLSDDSNPDLYGKNNSDKINKSGLRMSCIPNEDLISEINQIIDSDDRNFPFEYYIVRFNTFSGEAYSGYSRFIKSLTIDGSQINSDYANKEYTRSVYESHVNHVDRIRLKNEYRKYKSSFKENILSELNGSLENFDFAVRSGSRFNLETDINLIQDGVPIDERGKGQQCFIKTDFALRKSDVGQSINTLMLEEPENHLSHTNMKKLISNISNSHPNQIIIATHSSLISARLDLRNSILLNSCSDVPLKLKDVPCDTASFFMKAPDNNILEFILSSKVILVEGDAEYILLDLIYYSVTGRKMSEDSVHVISVGGTAFKRYMDLAKSIKIKVAVIRDNDGDYQSKCVNNYIKYVNENIKVFYDTDNDNRTFEICMYLANESSFKKLFTSSYIRKTPLEYMLDNKAEAALRILDGKEKIIVPNYIEEAIRWISE